MNLFFNVLAVLVKGSAPVEVIEADLRRVGRLEVIDIVGKD